ncbi:hypothetical protein DPMN_086327 [Dreissena polymorpha]|uniref:Uncharacterized protein n=1 Tax=Dreissena polymorpha TaxID=45954 RepID=A0A9D4KQT0_DREPO|nr:hypothetical protein DPMN_086327 [Dreissena polymorpha]
MAYIAPVSAGGVTVYRGPAVTLSWLYRDAAGFHRGSTRAYPATTGALPGLNWDEPQPVRGCTGLCRAVDRLQHGRHREIL